jgi:hypothetical protein
MEKRFAFAALLVLMTLSTVGFVSADYNGPPSTVTPGKTYTFTLAHEGASYAPSTPSLAGTKAKGYYDTYVMTISGSDTLKVTIVLEDCCTMGDTIALYQPLTTKLASAKSPALIVETYTLNPGTYYLYVAYTAAPAGFPAGYFIFFDATCGMSLKC